MAIGFVQVDTHHRSAGHSVAAAMAYRAGLTLRDNRTGELHDYSPRETREEIEDSGVAWSRPCPLAERCRTLDEPDQWQHLADVIEAREKHPRARILRDIKSAIPHELNLEQKKRLAKRIGEALAAYADTFVPYALHAPNTEGDARNWHTHHVLPTRALTEDGTGLGAKLRKLDLPSQSGREVAHIRNMIGELVNEALREAGITEEVRMGLRLDEPGERDIPARVLKLARQAVRKRRKKIPNMPAREIVNLAVANGDIEPFETASPRREPRQRRTVRGTPRPAPGYRRERRARSFRDRSIERAIQARDAALHDVLTEPAKEPAEHTLTVASGSGGSGVAGRLALTEETQQEPTSVAPVVPDAEAAPVAPPARARRRRKRKDHQEPGPERERSPRTREGRKRRRREPRGAPGTSAPEPGPAPMQGEQPDDELILAELEAEIERLQAEKRQAHLDAARAEPDAIAALAPPKTLELWVQERIDQARNWEVQVSTPPAKARALDVEALRERDARAERRKTLEEWAQPPMKANRREDFPEPRIQAHANTGGRPPDRAPFTDVDKFQAERQAKHEAALKADLETKVRAGTEAMGEAMIRRHAGDPNAHPALHGAGKEANEATRRALTPHISLFLVPERHRRRGYDHDRVQTHIERWRKHFARVGEQIVSTLLAAVWPAWRNEHARLHNAALEQAHANEKLDEERREWRKRQQRERAQQPTAPTPETDRDGGPSR